ncbi:D-alanyl-D-alanine carboxypeptidase family protein [Clostridium drakei]|uniref:serine-type D-Ala-D-Ala carboxypeptidase n=1 Tax=Clostridium drakei TaxID=332101 RepID=A0A2U8DNL5_9CLOT|nr:D-alanyl-D-alanine carboxypeptidase family protein [Clostridium drakei]AWI03814.1 D-alanyl-D-alanine carboxypeptidase [Clostridium drakei]
MLSVKNKFKYINILILTVFIVTLFVSIDVRALENSNDNGKENVTKDIYVDAGYAIALDSKSKVVLYEKKAYTLVPMASTTKIMTTLVAIKYGDLERKIEVSGKSAGIRGSKVGLKKGEKISLKELLYGLMLRSGNDAAIAIAEGVSGSVEEFVQLMNEYASEIGVLNTHFHSPHGLDYEDHYTTAYDLALITAKAKEIKLFNDIVSSKDVDGKTYNFTRSYHNINKILWELPDANGVKTGYTGKAGKCLVTSSKVQGNDVIVVVLNCRERWKETKKIYDYVNKSYQFKKIFSKGENAGSINLNKDILNLEYEDDIVIPLKNKVNYNVKIIKPEKIDGVIKKGDKVGNVCIYANENIIYKSNLIASNNYKKFKIWNFIMK